MEECEVKENNGLSNNLSLCIFLKIFLIEIFLLFTMFHIHLFDMTSNLHPIKKDVAQFHDLSLQA